jgi:hypothetical protein
MKTTVLGVRLTDEQREKLKKIGIDNRMGEAEVARALIDHAIDGSIRVERGKIVEKYDLSGVERVAKKHGKTVQQLLDMISEIE